MWEPTTVSDGVEVKWQSAKGRVVMMKHSLICLVISSTQMRKEIPRRSSMDNFVEMARGHRRRYLPTLYSRLEKEGKLEEHLATVARMAEEELLLLVSDQGMRHQEALELVLPKYILISPEEAPPDLPES
jgi:hypothetical protein